MAKKMISFEISDELREALRCEAFRRNKNISAVIRDILEDCLNKQQTGDQRHDK